MKNQSMKHINITQNSGFTVLELVVVLAIIATLSVLGNPLYQNWGAKRSLDSTANEIYSELNKARIDSFSNGLSTRVLTSKNENEYTITRYILDSSQESCDVNLNWAEESQKTIEVNNNFTITGTGIGNVCFYRDGTSNGGSFSIDQKNGGSDLGNIDIMITLATGFIDVIK